MVVFGLLIWSVNTAGSGGLYFAKDYVPPTVLADSVGKFQTSNSVQV